MLALGDKLGGLISAGSVVLLQGELGAGKTTFTRGFLHGKGHRGKVKSPTYTLVESYQFSAVEVHHFDLYRLNDPMELELMGFRDYFNSHSIVLIEWPQKAGAQLPEANLSITIEILAHNKRRLTLLGPVALLKEIN